MIITKIIVRVLPVAVILLIVFQIILTNEMVNYGRTVSQIDKRIDRLKNENEHMALQVASSSSLLYLEQKARELGFTDKPNLISLGQETVALSQLR